MSHQTKRTRRLRLHMYPSKHTCAEARLLHLHDIARDKDVHIVRQVG